MRFPVIFSARATESDRGLYSSRLGDVDCSLTNCSCAVGGQPMRCFSRYHAPAANAIERTIQIATLPI